MQLYNPLEKATFEKEREGADLGQWHDVQPPGPAGGTGAGRQRRSGWWAGALVLDYELSDLLKRLQSSGCCDSFSRPHSFGVAQNESSSVFQIPNKDNIPEPDGPALASPQKGPIQGK